MERKLLSADEYGKSLSPSISGRRVRVLIKQGKIPKEDCIKMSGKTGSWLVWSDAICDRRHYMKPYKEG